MVIPEDADTLDPAVHFPPQLACQASLIGAFRWGPTVKSRAPLLHSNQLLHLQLVLGT